MWCFSQEIVSARQITMMVKVTIWQWQLRSGKWLIAAVKAVTHVFIYFNRRVGATLIVEGKWNYIDLLQVFQLSSKAQVQIYILYYAKDEGMLCCRKETYQIIEIDILFQSQKLISDLLSLLHPSYFRDRGQSYQQRWIPPLILLIDSLCSQLEQFAGLDF